MSRADRSKVSTVLGRLLLRSGKCTCGHQKDYHISGKHKCMVGICPCHSFEKTD